MLSRTRHIIPLLIVLISACSETNPSPDSFLPYRVPEGLGMNEPVLREMDQRVTSGDYGDIHSVIILRNNNIVFEKYYSTYGRDDLHPMASATQSVVSTIFGVAMKQGFFPDFSKKLIDYFPQYPEYFEDIPQKDKIALRHLLSNTSGLWWDETSTPFGSLENDASAMYQSADWVKYVLAKPMIQEPGLSFKLNSGNAVLLGSILKTETEIPIETYTSENLFSKLNIDQWDWEKQPDGEANTAWGLHMRPMDFAKIGYLYLNNGVWQGDSLFQETWNIRATFPRVRASNYFRYGYHWWSFAENADAVRLLFKNDAFFAWGDSGQHLYIVPHLGLVVVVSSGKLEDSLAVVYLMRDYIFPSITNQ